MLADLGSKGGDAPHGHSASGFRGRRLQGALRQQFHNLKRSQSRANINKVGGGRQDTDAELPTYFLKKHLPSK